MASILRESFGFCLFASAHSALFCFVASVESDKKDKGDDQQAQQPANQTSQDAIQQPAPQTTQQPARRAISDGEVYELHWVN